MVKRAPRLAAAVFISGAALLLSGALGGCELLLDTGALSEANPDATSGDGSGGSSGGSSSGGDGSGSSSGGIDATGGDAADATAGDASDATTDGSSSGGGDASDSGDAMTGPEVGPTDAQPCTGPLYYVSTNGNDANPGCSPAAPKKTIAAAIAAAKLDSTSQPTIEVCAGTYPESNLQLDFQASLLGGFDCSFAGDAGSGGTTTITNASPATQSVTLLMFGSAAQLSGFTIQGAASVTPDGGTSALTYAALEITGSGNPIISNDVLTGGSGIGGAPASAGIWVNGPSTPLIENNTISGGSGAGGAASNAASVGVFVQNGAPIVRGNTIDGGSGNGVSPSSGGSAGVMAHAGAGDVTLDRNTISGGSGMVSTAIGNGTGSMAVWILGNSTPAAAYTITGNVLLAGTGSVETNNAAGAYAVRAALIGYSASVVFTGNTVDGGVVESGQECPQAVNISDPPSAPGSVVVSGNRIHAGHCTANAANLAGNTEMYGVRLSGPFTSLIVENNMIDSGEIDPTVHRLAGALLLTNGITSGQIRHNTLVAGGSGYYAIGLWLQGALPIGITVDNNIFAAAGPNALALNLDNTGFCSTDAGVSAAFTSVRNNLVFGALAGFLRLNCSNTVMTSLDAMDATLATEGTTVAGNVTIASSCAASDGGTLAGCIAMSCAAGGGTCLDTVFAGWDDANAGYANLLSDAGFEGGCPAVAPPVIGGIGYGWALATGDAGSPPCAVAHSSLSDGDGGAAPVPVDLYGNCRGANPSMGAAEYPPGATCF